MPEDVPEFEHEAEITLDELQIEPFVETRPVESFDCGNKDLDDFLTTEEVRNYEEEGTSFNEPGMNWVLPLRHRPDSSET